MAKWLPAGPQEKGTIHLPETEIIQPGYPTSGPPSQLPCFRASSQLLLPNMVKPPIPCTDGKPWLSSVEDAQRSPVKGQWGGQKTPSTPHMPMHPGLCSRVCTGVALWELHVWWFWPLCLSLWHWMLLTQWRSLISTTEGVGEKSGKYRTDTGWPFLGSEKRTVWLIKYICIQLTPGEEREKYSSASQKPQESRLLQNRKFRKAFPIPHKNMYLCSVGGLLFKLMPWLYSLTNKLRPGIAPVYN